MTREIAAFLVTVILLAMGLWAINFRKKAKLVWDTTPGGPYEVIVTEAGVTCTHASRSTDSIRWNDVEEILLVTTSDGPLLPDMWYVFSGGDGGVSIPSEAKGFDALWEELKTRFPGFDHSQILEAGTDHAKRLLWKKYMRIGAIYGKNISYCRVFVLLKTI